MKLSCGVVPVRKVNDEWEFLILRCFKNWDFPKGMKDPDESPLAAARREFTEETGLKKIEIIADQRFIETEPYSQNKVARYYLGLVTDATEVKILPNPVTGIIEHHEFRWLNASETKLRLVPRLQKVLAWALENLPGQNS
jgi:bis(5'-nucleosidyl)-tetraphosphatase